MTKPTASFHVSAVDTIVAIPTLNEAAHIEAVIRGLRRCDSSGARFEIWVVDGGSDDGTHEIVRRLSADSFSVRLLHNPDRTQASAINLAALEATKMGGVQYLVRADAHAGYPDDWVVRLIETAESENADSVVVPMRTCGGSEMSDASSDLFNSWLGNGGSPHRTCEKRGPVEHGHHALFRLDVLIEAGGYDPQFLANEDAELDVRLREQGRRIFLENRATIDYYPRSSLSGIWRQFFRNGKFRLRTSLKHKIPLQLRQLAPIGLSVTLFGFSVLGAVIHPALIAPVLVYIFLVLAAAFAVATKKTFRRAGLIALTAMTAHVAFGFGALATIFSRFCGVLNLTARRPNGETTPHSSPARNMSKLKMRV